MRILNFLSRKGNIREYMIIKLVIGKAYDRLEWKFIQTCFNDVGSLWEIDKLDHNDN